MIQCLNDEMLKCVMSVPIAIGMNERMSEYVMRQ